MDERGIRSLAFSSLILPMDVSASPVNFHPISSAVKQKYNHLNGPIVTLRGIGPIIRHLSLCSPRCIIAHKPS